MRGANVGDHARKKKKFTEGGIDPVNLKVPVIDKNHLWGRGWVR